MTGIDDGIDHQSIGGISYIANLEMSGEEVEVVPAQDDHKIFFVAPSSVAPFAKAEDVERTVDGLVTDTPSPIDIADLVWAAEPVPSTTLDDSPMQDTTDNNALRSLPSMPSPDLSRCFVTPYFAISPYIDEATVQVFFQPVLGECMMPSWEP